MSNVLIIDDAIDLEHQDIIEQNLLSPEFGWFFNSTSTRNYELDNSETYGISPIMPLNAKDLHQFVHGFYHNGQQNSNYFWLVLPILSAIPNTVKYIKRIKANLTAYIKNDAGGFIGIPHVDWKESSEHDLTAIYYVNDSTGDTIVYNEKYGHKGELTVSKTIAPKKGRLAIFNAQTFHAGNTPKTDAPRLVINFNITPYVK